MRNLDITTLRSFVAVAELGGVTRAAGFLNLTQSAVSMQLKRLEDLLGLALLERSGRGVSLTAAGEQLLSYARRMVDLNDEAFARLTHKDYAGEIHLGVPHDIVYPVIPRVLQRFAAEMPRMRVQLNASHTNKLKEMFDRGELDVILTTEGKLDRDGETLNEIPLRWVGAPGAQVWKQRPLRIAQGRVCAFRSDLISTLDDANVPWTSVVDTDSDRTIEATVSADLAVCTMLEGTAPPQLSELDNTDLPDLGVYLINMYTAGKRLSEPVARLADMIRAGYQPLRQVEPVRA
ncbi:Cyn operon transcriptional activator [Thalassovita gelatinovora]|uniref:Cyn operon transcriptional activator n=1 Tax=Thalassovita gelatinovora TaxID=53501 RepID=A0A0P1FXK2_THAGE|nr:LysR family transcriptional regulator [Thalassovita gelatinovora]QIZ80254.1 LysR family transcriptional regulator [Thalassovita gelatinovora]CUH64126.1 Cyn operon transcriptional activator [Thalassovita gelatinovora]SEQ83917.1 transcriptional regulator, LysR family [Thalassovita gelatinovora]